MCRAISLLNFDRISGLKNLSLCNTVKQEKTSEDNKLLPGNNENDRKLKVLANYIRLYEAQAKLPDFKDIYQKFQNGEIDPRNLKKGDEITLNLGGKNYTFKIEKDGEFTCQVKGRDNSVCIYQGKNVFGADCICIDYHYKKTECNIYVTYKSRIPVEEFDNKKEKQE